MAGTRSSQSLGFHGVAIIATAIGAVAVGAFAIGALAIGRLAIRRVQLDNAKIRSLEIDNLVVKRIRAADVTVSGSLKLPAGDIERQLSQPSDTHGG
jgi:hypothetical protein